MKFKGIIIEYDDKDFESLNRDLKILNSNYSDIIDEVETKQNIEARKLISVEYTKIRDNLSEFHLSFNTNESLHILSILIRISNSKIKRTESWIDG